MKFKFLSESMLPTNFVAIGKALSHMTNNDMDPGDFMSGWIVNELDASFDDRLVMFGSAVADAFSSNRLGGSSAVFSENVTCYAIPGVLARNYYLLFSTALTEEARDADIKAQLDDITLKILKEVERIIV